MTLATLFFFPAKVALGGQARGLDATQGEQPSSSNTVQQAQTTPSQPLEIPLEIYVWGEQPVSTATEQTVRQKDFERDEDRVSTIHGYTIFDLLAKYKWDRYEFLFSIINFANKKWRPRQFLHESQFPGEIAPVPDIHFTPGEPLTIKAGLTVHLW